MDDGSVAFYREGGGGGGRIEEGQDQSVLYCGGIEEGGRGRMSHDA